MLVAVPYEAAQAAWSARVFLRLTRVRSIGLGMMVCVGRRYRRLTCRLMLLKWKLGHWYTDDGSDLDVRCLRSSA
jgi:hypothetical protein